MDYGVFRMWMRAMVLPVSHRMDCTDAMPCVWQPFARVHQGDHVFFDRGGVGVAHGVEGEEEWVMAGRIPQEHPSRLKHGLGAHSG